MMKKMLEIYLRGNELFFSASSLSTVGCFVGSYPHLKTPDNISREEKGKLIIKVLTESPEYIEHPKNEEEWKAVGAPLLKLAGVKSWRAFEKGVISCHVYLEGDKLRFIPYVNKCSKKEGFISLDDKAITIPADASLETIGETLDKTLALSS